MANPNTNNRASLLAGLRTGGVRSSSINVPHTAAPTGAFNVSRFPSQQHPGFYPDDDEEDFGQFAQLPPQPAQQNRVPPMTAAVDGPNYRFAQQQTNRGVNPNSLPFSPGFAPNMTPQAQMQMQMIQLEMLRIQALQNQQYQLAQAQQIQQMQQQQQQQMQMQTRERRTSTGMGYNPPATAGPATNSFDLRAATLSAQMRRANQADQLRSQLGVRNTPSDVPLTAGLNGRFGSRSTSLNVLSQPEDPVDALSTSNTTTVISGGTSLGSPAPNHTSHTAPSKSDSVSSWRRGGNTNASRAVSSPSLKVTPPSDEQPPLPTGLSSPVSASGAKFRPQPLRFSSAVSQPLPAVAIDTTDEDTDGETQSSGSSTKSGASNSSPTTPRSSSSNESPLSPREEASKRLFEGLGIGRPVSATPSEQGAQQQAPTVSVNPGHRMVSQPMRQPRGPPSGTDELGPKNFATRIRRQAIGGLGVLMGARERRDIVEAY